MSIIIDTNCLCSVFVEKDEMHHLYKPVLSLLRAKKAKLIIGGSKYNEELRKLRQITKILAIFKTKHEAIIHINDGIVDAEEVRISSLITSSDFDDPHIAALVAASGCKIICTRDTRSIPFLKKKEIYPQGVCTPKFYTKPKNVTLFTNQNLNIHIRNRVH